MNKIIFLILAITTIILFSGCASKERVVYLEKPVYKYESIPNNILENNITIPKPLDREKFIKADPIERERMLVILVVDLYKTVGEYQLSIDKIKKYNNSFKSKVKQILKDHNVTSKVD